MLGINLKEVDRLLIRALAIAIICLAAKAFISEDVSLKVANAEFDLNNSRLETIEQANKIRNQSEKLQIIATQLQSQREEYKLLQDRYRELVDRTSRFLPADKQPGPPPSNLDLPDSEALEVISEELVESDRELSEQIEKVTAIE